MKHLQFHFEITSKDTLLILLLNLNKNA